MQRPTSPAPSARHAPARPAASRLRCVAGRRHGTRPGADRQRRRMPRLRHAHRGKPGPKGEAVLPGAVRRFCSTARALSSAVVATGKPPGPGAPVCPRHEPGRLAAPRRRRLIDATRAYYVVGVQRPGGMGATLTRSPTKRPRRALAARKAAGYCASTRSTRRCCRRGRRPPAPGTRRTEARAGARNPAADTAGAFRLARRGAAEAYFDEGALDQVVARLAHARRDLQAETVEARRWSLPACSGCRRSSHGRPADSSAAGR